VFFIFFGFFVFFAFFMFFDNVFFLYLFGLFLLFKFFFFVLLFCNIFSRRLAVGLEGPTIAAGSVTGAVAAARAASRGRISERRSELIKGLTAVCWSDIAPPFATLLGLRSPIR
jgi:hypothetical protein